MSILWKRKVFLVEPMAGNTMFFRHLHRLGSLCLGIQLAFGAMDSRAFLEESPDAFEDRTRWFRDARFGLFIHWGVYSTLGGTWQGENVSGYAEWIHAKANIEPAIYQREAVGFNPTRFDADQWVRCARDAGMRYLVITTKHHDGYCLWDSAYTEYDVKDASGWDFDPLQELSDACERNGIRFGTYYSIIDWHHDSQRVENEKWGRTLMRSPTDKARYVTYMKDQIRELIERYDTQILWFDADWVDWWTEEDGLDLYAYIRELSPDIIINNRVSKRATFKKDFGTPENFTPDERPDYLWEACWTINQSWGYKTSDTNWTSTPDLVKKLVDIVSKDGNLLLNVGPLPDGRFPDACVDRLGEMGDWLDTYGEAIYGARSSIVPTPSWGRITQRERNLYLHVYKWPENGCLTVEGLDFERVVGARCVGEESIRLSARETRGGTEFHLPAQSSRGEITVVAVELEEAVLGTMR